MAAPACAAAEPSPSRPPALQHLPIGTRCRGFLPCELSGDFGIHARLLAALSLDEAYRVTQGLLVPSLVLSMMNAAEVGIALPLRFYDVALPVPERLRLFGQLSLPKSLLPGAGASVFASGNLALGPFNEADAPSGARASSVDIGGALGGELGSLFHVGTAAWATLGPAQPELHAGLDLSLRTDYVTLFAQAQVFGPLGCLPTDPACASGLLATFGLSGPWEAVPTSAHVSTGRGAAPLLLVAVQGGLTYDVRVRDRHGDGIAAAERGWDNLIAPLRYRLLLRRRGYYDPHPDQNGLLRDDRDGSVLGILGVPHPTRPGYILTPSGISIPIGASLEVLGDRPLVASPEFPGRVISYLPLSGLTAAGRTSARPVFDETYFNWLEEERRREERAAQDDLRRMDSPWAKAALNALSKVLAAGPSWFIAAASPDTPAYSTLLAQSRLVPYRDGYEEYKGEIIEGLLIDAALLLADLTAGPGRRLATITARELATALSGLRAASTTSRASRAPRLLTHLAPRLNPGNYTIEIRGLGSNFGNVRLGYTGTEAAEAAEAAKTAEAAEHLRPSFAGSIEGEAPIFTDRTLPSRAPDPNAAPKGRPELPAKNDLAERIDSLRLQDEAAQTLAQGGYDVQRIHPMKSNLTQPDYLIEGRYFDCYSPTNPKPRNIWSEVKDKVERGQADRIVINLDGSTVELSELRKQFARWPIEGLREVIVVKNKQIYPL